MMPASIPMMADHDKEFDEGKPSFLHTYFSVAEPLSNLRSSISSPFEVK
jgi:hypothetical protein